MSFCLRCCMQRLDCPQTIQTEPSIVDVCEHKPWHWDASSPAPVPGCRACNASVKAHVGSQHDALGQVLRLLHNQEPGR